MNQSILPLSFFVDQVIRNFELMGQVNLDQLDAIKERDSSAEEEEEREEDGLGAMEEEIVEDEVEMEESMDEELEQKEKRIEEEGAEKPAPKGKQGSSSSLLI